ncbi:MULTISPECIES: helicase HerA-like domain-containing protein [unclassified Sulfitobacter]|uniref:helicase HerA-like domain-containing protein n=1 Tax=unclassified Sulfitobacter TaxID=196795 RepID=UPI0007C305BB|nr:MULTISPECIES: helicase HerA-like domain-containing protein [unclassified Sulfitobacter]KZX93202.1 ATP-binding protein [Sulfitobacter sp. HI0021]KZY03431.1 ATP-binding protein [Sulfitobacter sp. HI0027]KZZ01000.1 ATP-binding protein [Sulfitobacter sp. HI0076]
MSSDIFIGGGGPDHATKQFLDLSYANRHGLIAGATGTGKTVTLQILAEGFANAGVPVFLSDVKGDLSGLAVAGSETAKLHVPFTERAAKIGFDDYAYQSFPVTFWDLFGQQGHPVRTTVSEMGPLLIAQLLSLSEAQEGILNIAFRVADEEGMPLLDLKDLQSLLVWVGENAKDLALRYGNVSTASAGTIQRRLLVLENQGGAQLFGEPALALSDLMRCDADGRGRINILAADKLMASPKLYATFLLLLMSELFEELPEVGDPDKPKLVFFFDEAHLLFDDAPKALVDKVEQVARLIRSKGVGVYFVTQNPADVPDDILGQLGNRIQHALRAFTARDRKELRQAAETYRENPRFDTEEAIREVGVGEAVTSMLQRKGVPGVVERTLIRPPSSRLGPITVAERAAVLAESDLAGKYETVQDRNSAYEMLKARAEAAAKEAEKVEAAAEAEDEAAREFQKARRYGGARSGGGSRSGRKASDGFGDAIASAVIKELKGTTGRRIVRGILGGLFKGR